MIGSKKKRRKGKIYHLNAEFQRIARRNKKPFLSDQCKEIEENNRMGAGTPWSLILLKRFLVFPILLFSSISLH